MNIEYFKKAIDLCDGVNSLAKKINVKPNRVSMWIQRASIPTENIISICEATEFKVTPHELHADIYPHPHDGLPEAMRFHQTFIE